MIYEYALEPSLVVDWAIAGIGRCVGQFGIDYRRLVSDFPKDWKGHVYGDFLARFDYDYGHPEVTNTQPTLDAYLQLLTDCMVSRQVGMSLDAVWIDEAIREHTARPFHAIFAASQQAGLHSDIITEKNVDDIRDTHWWLPTIKTTRKSAAEIGAALRPILQAATEIYIVDPYFDAGEKRFQETFAEIVRQATSPPRAVSSTPIITLVTGVERFFRESEKPTNPQEEKKYLAAEVNVAANIEDLTRRNLLGLVPSAVTIRLVVLRKATGGDPLHNRFILTDVGAVIVPYGLADYDREANHVVKDDLTPMLLGMYEERWAQYAGKTMTNVVLGPVTMSGTQP